MSKTIAVLPSVLFVLALLACKGKTAGGTSGASASAVPTASSGVTGCTTRKCTPREITTEYEALLKEVESVERPEWNERLDTYLEKVGLELPVSMAPDAQKHFKLLSPSLAECRTDNALPLVCYAKVQALTATKASLRVRLLDPDGFKIDDSVTLRGEYEAGEKVRLKVWTMRSILAKNPASIELRLDDESSEKDDGSEAVPTAESEKLGTFPATVAKFIAMTELQQEKFASTFEGTVLSGAGKVSEVEKCGLLDDSKEYGTDCWKVILDVGAPRVALYYSSDDEERIEKVKKGQSLSFKDCAGISITNWGFWSTATCDMPRL